MAVDGGQVCTDINIVDDGSVETTEYINITISANNDSIIIDDPTIIVYIVDNNGICKFNLCNNSYVKIRLHSLILA